MRICSVIYIYIVIIRQQILRDITDRDVVFFFLCSWIDPASLHPKQHLVLSLLFLLAILIGVEQ